MSFREKSAWISLISILLVSTFYFLHVPWTLTPGPSRLMFHALLVALGLLIAIEVIAYVILAFQAPRDARTPKDERERLIELKALRVAAYIYVIGTFIAVASTHAGANAIAVSYGVTFSFVLAAVTNYAARIFYYRRGV